jgi:MerR family copper efflux transcriptional regulator
MSVSLTHPARTPTARGSAPRVVAPVADCSIGRAAEASGVSAKMIRYYESIGLIRPASRSAANYRTYDPAAIQTLRFIARARSLGFSVDEIAQLLALWQEPGRSSADVKALALAHVADLKKRIAALQSIKAVIETLAAHCHGDDRPECPILDELAGGLSARSGRVSKRHQG